MRLRQGTGEIPDGELAERRIVVAYAAVGAVEDAARRGPRLIERLADAAQSIAGQVADATRAGGGVFTEIQPTRSVFLDEAATA